MFGKIMGAMLYLCPELNLMCLVGLVGEHKDFQILFLVEKDILTGCVLQISLGICQTNTTTARALMDCLLAKGGE